MEIVNWLMKVVQKIALKTLNKQEWGTPQKLFNKLDEEFRFNLDPCASHENKKCNIYFTKKENGLWQKWFGRVFVNPPFRKVAKWVEKSYYEVKKGNAELVVMLIASRTDTRWFHKYIYKNPLATVRFIKGRVRYEGGKHPAPFPSMVVIFRRSI